MKIYPKQKKNENYSLLFGTCKQQLIEYPDPQIILSAKTAEYSNHPNNLMKDEKSSKIIILRYKCGYEF